MGCHVTCQVLETWIPVTSRQAGRRAGGQAGRRACRWISTVHHCSCCIESSEWMDIQYAENDALKQKAYIQLLLKLLRPESCEQPNNRIVTALMKTKFKTACKSFILSERLACESLTLKWNICECLVGCIDVKANNAGTIDSRYKPVLKEESILLWKWEYRISQRIQLLNARDWENWRHDMVLCYCDISVILHALSHWLLRYCGTPVILYTLSHWRHDWHYVTTALQLDDVTTGTTLLRHSS